jgi:hypothetical protein
LSNDEKKKELTQVLLDVWSKDEHAPKYKNKEIILICEEEAFLLQLPDDLKTTRTQKLLHSNPHKKRILELPSTVHMLNGMAICLSVSRVLTLTFSSSPVLRPAAEG